MRPTTSLSSQEIHAITWDATKGSPRFVSAACALLNEMQKSLWLLWRQRTVLLTEFVALVIFYPLLQFLIGNGEIEQAHVLPTLLAFLAYPLLFITTFKFVGDLREEVNSGTFEHMHLSPFAPVSLLLSRLVILVLEGAVIAAIIGVLMSWVLRVHIPLRLAGALPAALTIVDIIGFALLLGGLALALPQTGIVVSLFNGLIFLLNGTLIPLAWYPTWVQTLARFLPTTLGIQVTNKVILQHQSLAAVWADGTLPWLITYTVGLSVLGWLVFLLNDRRTLRRGISR